jgi:hypothetical protein
MSRMTAEIHTAKRGEKKKLFILPEKLFTLPKKFFRNGCGNLLLEALFALF